MKKQSIQTFKKVTRLSALAIAVTTTSLSAIERTTPAAEPKEKVATDQKPTSMPQVKQDAQAFLGVFGKPIDQVVAEQLGIDSGISLQFVKAGSPAAKVGIKSNDIITKIGKMPINHQSDIRKALAGKKPGNKINVELLSQGKKSTIQVKLGYRANLVKDKFNVQPRVAPKMGKLPKGFLPPEILQNLPPRQRKQIEQLFLGNGHIQGFEINPQLERLHKQFGDLKKRQGNPLQFNKLLQQGQLNMNLLDADGSIKLKGMNGTKEIELYNPEGKLLYKGPLNNEKDQAKVPKELQDRVKKFDLLNKQPKMNLLPLQGGAEARADIEQLKKLLLKGGVLPNQPLKNGKMEQRFEFHLGGKGSSTMSHMTDPKTGYKYSYRKDKEGKDVEVHDKTGKLLFSGPYNNEIDKESIPEEFRPFLRSIEPKIGGFGNRLELKLGE